MNASNAAKPRISRRAFVGGLAAVGLGMNALEANADSPTAEQNAKLDVLARTFMQTYGVPGMSVSIGRHGRIFYSQGFGWTDEARSMPTQNTTRFRIASLSKPITATAVFLLVQRGLLQTDQHVFGSEGILTPQFGPGPDGYLHKVRVDHLLTHTSGGWSNLVNDPMFQFGHLSTHELIASTIQKRRLAYAPGTRYAYSNFGYCLLGRVIEAVSEMRYGDFVLRHVLPAGSRMQLAGNTKEDRLDDESIYFGQAGDDDPYEFNTHRMDAHGGWIGTTEDLVRFLFKVDGEPTLPDLLEPSLREAMLTTGPAGGNYARGWATNSAGNAWHDGSLPGTTATMVVTGTGYCWAAIANSRRPGSDTNLAQDKLLWEMTRVFAAQH